MKYVAILGSTGSIGTNALEVVRHLGPDECQVVALAAHRNIDLLEKQVEEFCPTLVGVADEGRAGELEKRLKGRCRVVGGEEGIMACATHPGANFLLSALTGAAGIAPTLAAIEQGMDVGLANKEVLVAAGALIMRRVAERGVRLIPVDSEHSAIFQCLQGESASSVRRLILTASGGPFRNWSLAELQNVTVDLALNHPNWMMGAKITVDSSTLMNKGLEVIEAHHLFQIPVDQIEVVIHPQSIIHSMVEFEDKSILAQMGLPDMKLPIQYALTYPQRAPSLLTPLDFSKALQLAFAPPDTGRFPCLRLAREALVAGETAPCFLNAANEVLVSRFLKKELDWMGIARSLDKLMGRFSPRTAHSLEAILEVDRAAREEAWHI